MRILQRDRLSLKYNEALATEYLSYFKQMEETFSLENDIRVSALSTLSGSHYDGRAGCGRRGTVEGT